MQASLQLQEASAVAVAPLDRVSGRYFNVTGMPRPAEAHQLAARFASITIFYALSSVSGTTTIPILLACYHSYVSSYISNINTELYGCGCSFDIPVTFVDDWWLRSAHPILNVWLPYGPCTKKGLIHFCSLILSYL